MPPEVISIGATSNIDFIKARLDKEAKLLAKEGLKIDLQEKLAGKFTFINLNIDNFPSEAFTKDDTSRIFKQYIAKIISEMIIYKWEKIILWDIIKENYYYFDEEERKNIYQHALQYMENCDVNSDSYDKLYRIPRKSQILHKLLEFFYTNDKIVIEGFIKFRLKEYLNELNDVADKAVDDYIMEREYKEFVRLLKYFVDIQEPRVERIHVLVKPNGLFKLLDQDQKPVNKEYFDGLIYEVNDSQINYEDLLISALITIAPKELIFHTKGNPKVNNILDTIKDVFGSRLTCCEGCIICLDDQS